MRIERNPLTQRKIEEDLTSYQNAIYDRKKHIRKDVLDVYKFRAEYFRAQGFDVDSHIQNAEMLFKILEKEGQ
jgi:predicted transcriptional regulator YheO